MTRGAVYFHFASKRDLAQGVVEEQFVQDGVPERVCKLQEFVDTGMVVAYLMPRDPLLSAGARLSLGQDVFDDLGGGAIPGWISRLEALLVAAGERGELLPHVVPADTAWLVTAAWTGVQIQSQKLSGRADLERRAAGLFQHLMPSVAVPGVLGSLQMGPDAAPRWSPRWRPPGRRRRVPRRRASRSRRRRWSRTGSVWADGPTAAGSLAGRCGVDRGSVASLLAGASERRQTGRWSAGRLVGGRCGCGRIGGGAGSMGVRRRLRFVRARMRCVPGSWHGVDAAPRPWWRPFIPRKQTARSVLY